MTVAGQVEQQGFGLTGFGAVPGFPHRGRDRMAGLGCRYDTFAAREQDAGFESLQLRHSDCVDQAFLVQLADQRRIAVVTQTAGMDSRWHEIVSQGEHLHQRRQASSVSIIVGIHTLGQGRAGSRFDRDQLDILASRLVREERECDTTEVGTAAAGSENHVRIIVHQRKLLAGLFTDDGLVQQNVIEHGAQRIVGILAAGRFFDGFRNRYSQRALRVGVFSQDFTARFGHVGRTRENLRAPGLHHRTAIGLLLVTDLDHVHTDFKTKHLAGKRQ